MAHMDDGTSSLIDYTNLYILLVLFYFHFLQLNFNMPPLLFYIKSEEELISFKVISKYFWNY